MPDAAEAAVGAVAWLQRLGRQPHSTDEALALVVHALLLRHGFRRMDALPTEPGLDPLPPAEAVLPRNWAPSDTAAGYGTDYRHQRSAMTFSVRVVPVGADRVMVTALAHETPDAVRTLVLRPSEYVRQHRWEAVRQAGDDDDTAMDWDDLVQNWQKLATLLQVDIVHALVPESAKDGYESVASGTQTPNTAGGVPARDRDRTRQPPRSPHIDPAPPPPLLPPLRPLADERDPLRVRPPLYGPAVGDDDLFPPSPWRSRGPSGMPPPPPPSGSGGEGGGGMWVGPRHPVFRGRGGNDDGRSGTRDELFGDGRWLPPEARPPGARIDPFGPPLPPDAQPRPPTAAPRRDYGDLDPPPPDTMYM